MVHNTSNDNNRTESTGKSGTAAINVHEEDSLRLKAEYINTTNRKTIYHLIRRSDGIDFTVTDGGVVARSDRAQALLNAATGNDSETVEDADMDTQHAVMTDGGRDVMVVEGQPDPENAVNIGLMYDGYDWCVSFDSLTEWSQNDLEPWLEYRLKAPGTVTEAEDDKQVFVPEKEHTPAEMRDVSFHQDVLARGEYNAENNTWVVDLVVADKDTGDDEIPAHN